MHGINTGVLWMLAVVASVAAGLVGGVLLHDAREQQRLDDLEHDAQRLGIKLMSLTLNGGLMGATELLGRVDPDIKREARGELAPNGENVTRLLKAVMRSGDSDGGFIVGRDGVIKSSFGLGKSSTGVDVQFRPYFKAAMAGKQNVYAAIGTTTGRRTLYFAAPAYEGDEPDTPIVGAVVARGGIEPIDKLLTARRDTALLLSPQGVVFAASRSEWVGFMAGRPAPERLAKIRATKQFGTLFDTREPSLLPVPVDAGRHSLAGGRYAVAPETISWNDPLGDWRLVLIEDLAASTPLRDSSVIGVVLGCVVFALLALTMSAWRSRQAERLAAARIDSYAQRQQRAVERKSRQAAAAIRMQQAHGGDDIARVFLLEAHPLLNAFQGAVYVVGDANPQRLRLAASYAGSDATPSELALGETLLGECALAGGSRVITAPPAALWTIDSGLGHAPPAAVMMGAVKMQGELLGAVELAVMTMPDEDLRQIFDEMLELLAVNLKLASRNRSEGTAT